MSRVNIVALSDPRKTCYGSPYLEMTHHYFRWFDQNQAFKALKNASVITNPSKILVSRFC
jgi:hypothetical protein